MKIRGFFQSREERTYNKKDGSVGRTIECMFQLAGGMDVIRMTTWRDIQWCEEHGIKTGAAGEVTVHFGPNNFGYYEQSIWGFKTQEQIMREESGRDATALNIAPQEKTPEMEAAAEKRKQEAQESAEKAQQQGEDTTHLPF